ncbi:hypothetical protein HPP92_001392 [Vanilla planifolia]|uniref:DUF7648 domain-containing protein n=1 Tax=Vanilla planifolia TaxID=51239 RepID=A0A835RZ69_VANPL|nr:hypothetical protein HPP92_001392 [Vanilla planifolia]
MVHDNPVGSDPLIEMKGRSDLKDVPKACYAIKLSGAKPNQSVPTIQKVVPTGKELSVSKSPLVSKPSVSNSRNSTSTATSSPLSGKAINVVKQQRMKMNSSSSGKSDTAKDNEQENPPLTLKAVLMAENNVASKSLQAGKISNLSGSKNIPLDSQQPIAIPENLAETPVTTTSITAEVTNLPHSTSNQPKPTPVSSHKSDKVIHPSAPSGSKFSGHSVVSQASPSTNNAAMLSDEELALLLHQELNSSPRVPRVFKRKHKEDSIKDGPHKLRDAVVESRRLGQHSPEPKQHESAFLNEGLAKKGKRSRSPDTINPSKAGAVDTSNEGSNSLAPDENGAKTSVRNSPANVGRGGTAVVRSLPGLIDDIMSKGKCSTYEELCDAVRPYWHSLRKPNGERYAYSSHSQAVLDCLRNRSEWAHLIDRGPKTNASKRRRKVDPESSAMESDHEDAKNKGPKEMGDKNSGNSCRDDFPKGKRNVRKPRLLEVRGRGMKEGKNRRRSAFFDDSCPTFSHSSNEETECHANDEDGETDTSSGDSD